MADGVGPETDRRCLLKIFDGAEERRGEPGEIVRRFLAEIAFDHAFHQCVIDAGSGIDFVIENDSELRWRFVP